MPAASRPTAAFPVPPSLAAAASPAPASPAAAPGPPPDLPVDLPADLRIGPLRALIAIVAEGSISAGARRLGMAQPTLTRAIKQLEWNLGVAVLARGPGGLELTDFGHRLLPHARRLVHAHDKAQEAAAQLAGATGGTVTLGASALPRLLLLPQAARTLWARYPQVRLAVNEGAWPHVLRRFETEGLDFALCPIPAGTDLPDYTTETLFEAQLAATVRAGHPLRGARRLADLAQCEWIAAGPQFGQGLREAFEANGLPAPTARVHCESLEYALRLASETDMVTLAPAAVVAHSLLANALTQPRLRDPLPTLSIGLVLPVRRALSPAAQTLLDAVRAAARKPARRSRAKP